jgi:hypothetical protein
MNQNESLVETYSTFDLALSAYLIQVGYPLTYLDRSDPKKVAFCFERDEKIETVIQEYWSGQQSVEPKSYFAAIRDLKSQIYSR